MGSKRYMTIVLAVPNEWKPDEWIPTGPVVDDPLVSAMSWSHALDDRDKAKAEVAKLQAELEALKKQRVQTPTVELVTPSDNVVTDLSSLPCHCRACLKDKVTKYGFPLANTLFIACHVCGNKRCPKATNHEHDCTSSNEPGQPGSVY